MPSISESHIEQEKAALVASFMAVAQSMKNCARMAETFAGYIKEGSVSPADAKLAAFDFSKLDVQVAGSTTRKRASKETAEGTGKRVRKEKKLKDPNAPKRPPSAYLLYQNAVRDEIRQKFPDVPYQVLLAEISKAWHNLTDVERQPYLDATKLSKEAFLIKKADYDQGKTDEAAAAAVVVPKQQVVQTPSSEEEDEESSEEEPRTKLHPNDSSSGSESDVEEEEAAPPKKKAKKNATPTPPMPVPAPKGQKKAKDAVPVTLSKKKKDKA